MPQFIEGNHRAFKAAGAIAQYARVKLSAADTVTTAGLTDAEIGIATRQAFNAGDMVDVLLVTANGTTPFLASGSITADATLYTAASGKVSATQATGALAVGTAIEAAADGAWFEGVRRGYIA